MVIDLNHPLAPHMQVYSSGKMLGRVAHIDTDTKIATRDDGKTLEYDFWTVSTTLPKNLAKMAVDLGASPRRRIRRYAKLLREVLAIKQDLVDPLSVRVAGTTELTYTRGGTLFWDSPTKSFSIDASDIREWRPGDDVSITNSLKGGTALYAGRPYREERDRDGDLLFWRLEGPHGTYLTIFND